MKEDFFNSFKLTGNGGVSEPQGSEPQGSELKGK